MFHTGYISNQTVSFSKDQLDGACNDARYPDAMSLELSLENYEGEYTTDAAVNRLEAYEALTQIGDLYVGNMVDTYYSLVAKIRKEYAIIGG